MNAIIQQGRFVGTGAAKTLKIRSEVDWMRIVNYTESAAANNGRGVEYYWQKGMGTNTIMKYRPAGDQTLASIVLAASINVIDSSSFALGARTLVTAGTDVVQPLYNTGNTTGLLAGGIVRLDSTNHNNLNGLDFSVDTVTGNTSFRLANTLATAPGRVAGGAGYYRTIAPNIEIYTMFTPSHRVISNITAAASAVVTTLVDHGYAIGGRVKFNIEPGNSMTQINGLTGNVTAITANTFTVDIDSSTFTAFTFPLYTAVPYRPSMVVPIGTNPGYASGTNLDSAFNNQGFIGVVLPFGTALPGGSTNDVIYWQAGSSERIDNN